MSTPMSPVEPTNESPSESNPASEPNEWIYRGCATIAAVLLVWLAYRSRFDGLLPLLIIPLIIGAILIALRLEVVSEWVNSIEHWLRKGSAKAAANDGKFARFFKRPFFGLCLAVWRWTAPIPDAHLRAGVRLSSLIILSATAIVLIASLAYIVLVLAIIVAIFAFGLWVLSVWAGSGSGTTTRVTRYTTDWIGRPKQEHFDGDGNKVGESRPDTDWLGNPKMVNTDAEGNVIGESKPDTDWLGNPKTVHRDAEGNVVGESRPDTDWFGNPTTLHTDADGNVTGESRTEKDFLGRPETVRREK